MAVILLLIVFTNVRLRGINSVVALLAVAFIAVVLAWFGWWDEIAQLIPYLSVHMNTGFYVVFSTGLFIIWALMFFVFDRLTYWRIRPAQMTEEHLIGGGAESFDTNGLLDRLLLQLLPDAVASNSEKNRSLCHSLGAPQIQAVRPSDQGSKGLVRTAAPGKPHTPRSLAAMSWKRPNIGSRVTREGHARFWERLEVKVLRATRHGLPT